jgi:ribosomal protein S18 acetylase RimI-like enzyme
MAELGYPTDATAFAERANAVCNNQDDVILIAEEEGNILGLVAVHSFEMLHRAGRLGRITALIVSVPARNRGIGRQLLDAAEKHLLANGCVKLEVTSGEQRTEAHGFYAAHGYHEQRVHFVKATAPSPSFVAQADKVL